MNITIRKDEEVHKIFVDNHYSGYLTTEGDLYCFDKINGYAQFVDKGIECDRAISRFRDHIKPKKKRRNRKTEIKLMKDMLARLVVYDPNSPIVNKVNSYLKEVE